MDIPQLYDSPLSLLVLWFIVTYAIGYFIIFRNWDKKYRSEVSSCLLSLAHGTPALILSILSIYQSQNINISEVDFTSPNTPFQNLVLEHSIAYFLVDLLHYMILIPSDVLFIAHHIATLYVLMTCRYLFFHGAVAVLGILALAESTTTCQNTWSLARYRRKDSDKAAAVFELVSPLFYSYYSVARGIVGPIFACVVGLFFARGVGGVIPRWGWISWMVVIGVGIVVVLHLWMDLYRQVHEGDEVELGCSIV